MQKLLNIYRANPTPANAIAIVRYNFKHPMAVCMLSITDISLVDRLTYDAKQNA